VATALVSIASAVGNRHGATALSEGVLVVPLVMRGQLWRLVTWELYEFDAFPLIFACLTLWWFGKDVAVRLGRRRFLGFYLGLSAFVGAVVSLMGQFLWTELASFPHAGSWPVLSGLMVTWGMLFADRQFRFWGVPLTGRYVVGLTLLGTALLALFRGLPLYTPHFIAEGTVLLVFRLQRRAAARRKELQQKGLRGEAWSFDAWYEKEKRR
jgi:membrane associated rhomboid family serine protease